MARLRCHRDCIGSYVQSRISGRRSSLTLIAASPVRDLLLPGSRAPMYPYVAVHGPTYRENSHANHTWSPPSRQSVCFSARNVPSVWVRFPSPAPFLGLPQTTLDNWQTLIAFSSGLRALREREPRAGVGDSDSQHARRKLGYLKTRFLSRPGCGLQLNSHLGSPRII